MPHHEYLVYVWKNYVEHDRPRKARIMLCALSNAFESGSGGILAKYIKPILSIFNEKMGMAKAILRKYRSDPLYQKLEKEMSLPSISFLTGRVPGGNYLEKLLSLAEFLEFIMTIRGDQFDEITKDDIARKFPESKGKALIPKPLSAPSWYYDIGDAAGLLPEVSAVINGWNAK